MHQPDVHRRYGFWRHLPRPGAPGWVVLGATVIGFVLRVYRLGAQSLWIDEVATYLSSAGSAWWVLTQRQYDGSVPPLYFLVVNAVLHVGDSEAALRAVSAVAGAASIPLLYAVARRWVGDARATLAAAFLALSPFHVWYSQEARAYALLVLLGLATVRAAQVGAERPDVWQPQAALAVLLVASFYCHSGGLALLPVSAVLVALETPRVQWTRVAPRWALVFAGAGLAILPGYLRYFTIDRYPGNHTDGSFNPAALGFTLWTFATGFSLGPSLAEWHAAPAGRVARAAAPLVVPVLLAAAALLALGVRSTWRCSPRALLALTTYAGVPVAMAVAGSIWARYPYNVRYVVLAFPAFVVLLAAGVAALRRAWASGVAATAACTLSAVSLQHYYSDARYAREDNRGASAFIARVGNAGRDPIVVSAAYTAPVLVYYSRGRSLRVLPFATDALGSDTAAMAAAAARLVGAAPRLSLFLSRTYDRDDARVLRRYLNACFVPDAAYHGPGVEVIHYVRGAAQPVGCVTSP
ncbi:MAG TPA: glycosyltransferase family 39 protein [Gemmatirosa sp.]